MQQGGKGNLIHIYAYIFYRAFLVEGAAGKPVKPFEAWMETVSDVIVGDANPKATQQEA